MSSLVADAGGAAALTASMQSGELSAAEFVERCLARIDEVDADVQAWISVDAAGARRSAALLDEKRASGALLGPLHGLPFAVKDVIDLAGYPTRAGSRSRAAAAPASIDATVVARLRAQGAIPLGKVHTTEFAYYDGVPPTRNPHDPSRTPGGSSGGPAAAVASGTVPLALGTQTAGSVSRPAAYCGIGAFKPSTLAVVGAGVTPFAPSFDTVGIFASSAADAAFAVAALAPEGVGYDRRADPPPEVAMFIEDPLIDDKASPDAVTALADLEPMLVLAGLAVQHAPSPVSMQVLLDLHRDVLLYELGRVHASLLDVEDLIGTRLATDIRAGLAIDDTAYQEAQAGLIAARRTFWSALDWPALTVLPAAPGFAPVGEATGDPSFISPMTALGGPIASLPLLHDLGALPLGAMLCAPPGYDAALARAVRLLKF